MTHQDPGDGSLRTTLIALSCLVIQILGAIFLAFLVLVSIRMRREQESIERKVDWAIRSHAEIRANARRHEEENRKQIDENTRRIESLLRDLSPDGRGR